MKFSSRKILTPARLHFGMFALDDEIRSFGGLGMMIRDHKIEVTVKPAEKFSCHGTHIERATQCADRWFANQLRFQEQGGVADSKGELSVALLERKIAIGVDSPPLHVGLGVGTQLAMAIGATLQAYFNLEMPAAAELALSMGRGRRSAVGSYGFGIGGLIVDGGREKSSAFPDLSGRFAIPEAWRFVLVQPDVQHEVFGGMENAAFDELDVVSDQTRNELIQIAQTLLIPAVINVDFEQFSSSLGEFNRKSGELFAKAQGGSFHGKEIENIVSELRAAGFNGVGQSSWGPTLFVAAENDLQASQIEKLAMKLVHPHGSVSITAADNVGYRFERLAQIVHVS